MGKRKEKSLPLSGWDERLRDDFPVLLASGFTIHQLDLPVPSFWTRMNLLWRDKLCRIEFWKIEKNYCYFTGTNFRRRLRAASNWGTTDSTFFIISAEHKMHFYQFIISVKLPGGHYKIKSIHLIEDLLSHYLLWHGIYYKTRAECILN